MLQKGKQSMLVHNASLVYTFIDYLDLVDFYFELIWFYYFYDVVKSGR